MKDDLELFSEKLKELSIETELSREGIREHFEGIELREDQLDKIIIYLKNAGKNVDDTLSSGRRADGSTRYDLYDFSLPRGVTKDDSLRSFLEVLEMYPPLTPESEQKLVRACLEGNTQASKTLTEGNMRLVFCIAKDVYRNYDHLDFYEMIQEGMAGLLNAVTELEEPGDMGFGDRAEQKVREGIMDWVMAAEKEADGTGDIVNTLNRIKDAFDELSRDLGYEPDAQEIADHLEITRQRVLELAEFSGFTVRH